MSVTPPRKKSPEEMDLQLRLRKIDNGFVVKTNRGEVYASSVENLIEVLEDKVQWHAKLVWKVGK